MGEEGEDPVIGTIEITLRARSKAGRYYSPRSIFNRLVQQDGELYRDDGDTWYLFTTRTHAPGPPNRIVILFGIAGSTHTVLTQTSDHCEWGELVHVQNQPIAFIEDCQLESE